MLNTQGEPRDGNDPVMSYPPTDSKSRHSSLGLEESFIEKLIPECVGRSTNERYNLAKLITPKVLLPSPEAARVIRA